MTFIQQKLTYSRLPELFKWMARQVRFTNVLSVKSVAKKAGLAEKTVEMAQQGISTVYSPARGAKRYNSLRDIGVAYNVHFTARNARGATIDIDDANVVAEMRKAVKEASSQLTGSEFKRLTGLSTGMQWRIVHDDMNEVSEIAIIAVYSTLVESLYF